MPQLLMLELAFLIFITPILPHSVTPPTQEPIRITNTADQELAERYAPVLYFHERERYRPQPIDVMLENARLRQVIAGVEATIDSPVSIDDFAAAPDDAYLDLYYGSDTTSHYLNYTAHGEYYDTRELLAQYPPSIYARVVHNPDGRSAIQYWFFYYYNDWYNKHEGDWEMIQVELDALEQPLRATYAQHHGGTARPWDAISKIDDTHPRAFVALGSHATYFAADTLYPQGTFVGRQRIDVYDRTGRFDPLIPQIVMLSETDAAWLNFKGRWGEIAPSDLSGPTGPAQKGDQWTDPFAWADAQPKDAEEWYHRNIRIDATTLPDALDVELDDPAADRIIDASNTRQSLILYTLPNPTQRFLLDLQVYQDIAASVTIVWPSVDAGIVLDRHYALRLTSGSHFTTQLCDACDFALDPGDGSPGIHPTSINSHRVQFDPPELVLFYLPFEQVVAGLLIALLATIIPSAIYAFAVWWLDRYEKEPIRLLLIVFLWGAIPGAIVAVAARFLVVGTLAPAITESVKALAIAFIYWRYRKEFNNMLDGVTYGAMTGVGFALTTNLITYALGFLVGGFDFLRASVLLNGIAFGLSEAFYGAVIGIGFGVAQATKDKAVIVIAPLIALIVAIILHIANDALRSLAVGGQPALVIIPFFFTWGGIFAIVAIVLLSIRKEQQTLQQQLEIERDLRTLTPNEYFQLSTNARQSKALARAFRQGVAEFARTLRLQELARQLAYRRRELQKQNIDPAHDAVIADLRQRIAALRPTSHQHDNR